MTIYKGNQIIAGGTLPDQTGKSGKYLTTDGSNASWGTIDLSNKQDTLVSGTNIKTVNNNSILGSGNLNIQGMPIGTIYPVNCTASYVPNGALPCDGSQYTKAQFNDLWTNYLNTVSPATEPLLKTCTYAEYSTAITTYGQCPMFAVDSENETFKVPTIKDGSYVAQALSDSELGKSYNESLPNITGEIYSASNDRGLVQSGATSSGALKTGTATSGGFATSGTGNTKNALGFDASLSSSTYQNNAKVQGDNVRLRYFVQVATGQINQSQMDWSAWASGLQSKANTDLSNLSATGKSTISKYPMPSNRYTDLTLGASGTTYTAPANGWILVHNSDCTLLCLFKSNSSTLDDNSFSLGEYSGALQRNTRYVLPVKKDDYYFVVYDGSNVCFRFYYAEGEQ